MQTMLNKEQFIFHHGMYICIPDTFYAAGILNSKYAGAVIKFTFNYIYLRDKINPGVTLPG